MDLDELTALIAMDPELDSELAALCDILDGVDSNAVDTPRSKGNKFQQRQRQEILSLRRRVQLLQAELDNLRSNPPCRSIDVNAHVWAAAAKRELLARTQAMQENAHLRTEVTKNATFIETMAAMCNKQSIEKVFLHLLTLVNIVQAQNTKSDWQHYKLAAQKSLRVAAIHAIADRQYQLQQNAFIRANIFHRVSEEIIRTDIHIQPTNKVLIEFVLHQRFPAPMEIVANAFWSAMRGKNEVPVPPPASRSMETIDDDTIYQKYNTYVNGRNIYMNVIYKQYHEATRRVCVWRSVIEDALIPHMTIGACAVQWGWTVIEAIDPER
ncbi:hypothetical protein THRCLA_23416, partial [Thraustotheca clavata]